MDGKGCLALYNSEEYIEPKGVKSSSQLKKKEEEGNRKQWELESSVLVHDCALQGSATRAEGREGEEKVLDAFAFIFTKVKCKGTLCVLQSLQSLTFPSLGK